ncbi:unnamed protein product [Prorocentrum cordatum]|uniref:non-specific serine/threonine protein kinase n=1 Tax=Prorocentrum cordatum TaxID=2364126 RepID=A0ABN9Y9E1_9DINO|nr:unnamed protein product [Polarella glacialis]
MNACILSPAYPVMSKRSAVRDNLHINYDETPPAIYQASAGHACLRDAQHMTRRLLITRLRWRAVALRARTSPSSDFPASRAPQGVRRAPWGPLQSPSVEPAPATPPLAHPCAVRSGAMFEQRYEVLRALGCGAYGAAHLVRRRGPREGGPGAGAEELQVAKEVNMPHLDEKQRQVAVAESEVLRKMSHPNIIGYIDSFLQGPKLYIVMEYADGGDLADKIRECKDAENILSEAEVVCVHLQLVFALMHVHGHKILHRDLKPHNVFLTRGGLVKLGDFGVARVLESTAAEAQTCIGTPLYLSPEICNNKPYGVQSDLWSLGVVTYELAALRVPFRASNLPALMMQVLGAVPDPLPEPFSRGLGQIVLGLLDKDPARRPSLRAVVRTPLAERHARLLLAGSRARLGAGRSPPPRPAEEALPNVPQHAEDALEAERRHREIALAEYRRSRGIAARARRRNQSNIGLLAPACPARSPPPRRAPAPPRAARQPDGRASDAAAGGADARSEVRRRAEFERRRKEAAHLEQLDRARRQFEEDRRVAARRGLAQQASSDAGWPACGRQLGQAEVEEGGAGCEGAAAAAPLARPDGAAAAAAGGAALEGPQAPAGCERTSAVAPQALGLPLRAAAVEAQAVTLLPQPQGVSCERTRVPQPGGEAWPDWQTQAAGRLAAAGRQVWVTVGADLAAEACSPLLPPDATVCEQTSVSRVSHDLARLEVLFAAVVDLGGGSVGAAATLAAEAAERTLGLGELALSGLEHGEAALPPVLEVTLPPVLDLTVSAASVSSLALCAATAAACEEAAAGTAVGPERLEEQPRSARDVVRAAQVPPVPAAGAAVAPPAPGPEFEHGHQFDGRAARDLSPGIGGTEPLGPEAGPPRQPHPEGPAGRPPPAQRCCCALM